MTTAPAADALAARCSAAPRPASRRAAEAKLTDLLAACSPDLPALRDVLDAGPLRDHVLAIADHSPFLSRIVARNPQALWRVACAEAPEAVLQKLCEAQRQGIDLDGAGPAEERAGAMRRNRALLALLVALADLGGVWSVDEVVAALSDFADASVQGGVDALLRELHAGGKLVLPNPDAPGEGSGLVVLALGKHGARELNYSSDIDIVVFYDPAAPALPEGAEPGRLYARLAQNLSKLLQERTVDGYVHRVDYRLRPDPGSTPVAVSLPAAYTYYETVGQNWERAAMIKAWPIAGDLALGHRFLADLAPFIWRKYFDFAAIADVHAMKRQIHAVRGHDEIAVAGHDIKLGRGGIREVEFFVQTQQLVFGGRRPNLRGRRTLEMLAALHNEGWITPLARDELAAAYRFLRNVEHRLQMVNDEQTQRLPSDPEELRRFAKFCGFAGTAAFSKALCGHARKVQSHYAMLFEEGPELAADGGSLVFTGTSDDPETLATLQRLGFRDPPAVAETVRGWHFGRRSAIRTPRAREVLTELTPALLAALGGTADPDGALAALDRAFGRMPAAVELLTILQSNDRLRLLFADLLGTAPQLAEMVAYSPHVLDAVIDPAFVEPRSDEAEIEKRVRGLIGKPAAFEDFLDRLRDAARHIRFLAGARLISNVFTPALAGNAYAAIARAVVRAALEATMAEFARDHGAVPGARIAVLGLGRLGSRELTAGSDLDLVVLYDFDEERRESAGAKPLDATVYFSRLTQRLVSALTVPTRRGLLYEVDLRLRPQGGKGPLASQFKGFVAYQRGEAELWEHMALTRAAPLAGDESLLADAMDAIGDILRIERDPRVVGREVAEMRKLIAQEKGEDDPWDVKLAAGGLTDLEFVGQALKLVHARSHPGLVGRFGAAFFAEAARLGFLAESDAQVLSEAYDLQNGVLQWQRLLVSGRFDAETVAPAIVRRVATALGAPDAKVLLRDLKERQRSARAIFSSVMAGFGA